MSIRELIEHAQNLVAFAKSDLYQCNTSEPLDAKILSGFALKNINAARELLYRASITLENARNKIEVEQRRPQSPPRPPPEHRGRMKLECLASVFDNGQKAMPRSQAVRELMRVSGLKMTACYAALVTDSYSRYGCCLQEIAGNLYFSPPIKK